MLALRLWPFMPPSLISECRMLPRDCPAPSPGAFTGAKDAKSASTAGAAFMTGPYLSSLRGALADSASHPRIHSVWLTLLSLLIPGFTPVKVTLYLAKLAQPSIMSAARRTTQRVYLPIGNLVEGVLEPHISGHGNMETRETHPSEHVLPLSIHHHGMTCQAARPECISSVQGEVGARAERRNVSSAAMQALWGWVDSNLLASSHDRKYLAFQLFTILLPSVR